MDQVCYYLVTGLLGQKLSPVPTARSSGSGPRLWRNAANIVRGRDTELGPHSDGLTPTPGLRGAEAGSQARATAILLISWFQGTHGIKLLLLFAEV